MRQVHVRMGSLRGGVWVARADDRVRDLPYQSLIEASERTGTVLHREDIYRSGHPVDQISDEILAFVLANTGDSVLDVGCGAGPYVAAINAAGCDVSAWTLILRRWARRAALAVR